MGEGCAVAGAGASAFALNNTHRPPVLASRVFVPTVEPSAQLVSRAMPSAPVTTEPGVAEPPAALGVNATVTPEIGLPL